MPASPRPPPQRRYMLLNIEKLVFEGHALARQDGFVWFVDGALPGEVVDADMRRRARRHGFARAVRIVEASPFRRAPACPAFGRCGGCHLLHLDYAEQVKAKEGFVREALRRIPGLDAALRPLWPSPRIEGFRNRMSFSVGREAGDVVLGLHHRSRPDAWVSARACVLPLPGIRTAAVSAETALRASPPDDLPTRMDIRESEHTGECMIRFFMPSSRPPADALRDALSPHAREMAWTMPDGTTRIAPGSRGWITERLDRHEFRLGPDDFFQTHTPQAERLFQAVRDAARDGPARLAWDVYAGVGAISCFLAEAAGRVLAVEGRAPAARAARRNAERNGLGHVRVLCADAARMPMAGPKPDLVVVDPPRAGLSPELRSRLCGLAADRIFYISCHPATLARDLEDFIRAGYRMERVQPIDMFPHTFHVETWVVLHRAR